jgi:hypothetical protein
MPEEIDKLRQLICEVLSRDNGIKTLIETQKNRNVVGIWWVFEEFAANILEEAGFTGGYRDIILRTKEKLEKEGWKFSDY